MVSQSMKNEDKHGNALRGGAKMKQRGHVALKEIEQMQSHAEPCIPFAPFRRLCLEILQTTTQEILDKQAAVEAAVGPREPRVVHPRKPWVAVHMNHEAVKCLREAAEGYVVHLLSDAYALCVNTGKVDLNTKHIQLARCISVGAVDPQLAIGAQVGHGRLTMLTIKKKRAKKMSGTKK